MGLRDQLLLELGGGIYYSNARVPADENWPTLFVGLGGTGADALIRIKNEICRRMEPQRDNNTNRIVSKVPKNIGFLAFDTDALTETLTYGSASFDNFGTEFSSLTVDGITNIIPGIRDMAANGDPIWKWYDGINVINATQGAGGIRQVGRLLLFLNIQKVYNDIRNKLRAITTDSRNVRIILLTGISGGTGSGIFLDMAYLLRYIATSTDGAGINNTQMLGYIVMPDVNALKYQDAAEKFNSNGFACLKELDYWMNAGEHEQNFNVRYSGSIVVNKLAQPFDFCHLLGAKDMGGKSLTYDDVMNNIAVNVFSYIAGGVAANAATTAATSMYDNINGYVRDAAKDVPYPACYRFLSVGAAKLEIPYVEISTLVAARLFEKLEPTLNNKPDEAMFNVDLNRLGLQENVMRAMLTNGLRNNPLTGMQYRSQDIWNKRDGTNAAKNRAYIDVYNWINDLKACAKKNKENMPSDYEGKLIKYIQTAISDLNFGPCYIAALLNSSTNYCLLKTLDAWSQHCTSMEQQGMGRRNGLVMEMEAAYRTGDNAFIHTNAILADYLRALSNWAGNEQEIEVYTHLKAVLMKLAVRFKLYYTNIFKPLSDILRELAVLFKQNVEFIYSEYNKKLNQGFDDKYTLIQTVQFENDHKREFAQAVEIVRRDFLADMGDNLKKWIGRGIDDVEGNITPDVDIPGFIADFISYRFNALLTIDIQSILQSKVTAGNDFTSYMRKLTEAIINDSVPMYKPYPSPYDMSFQKSFGIISIPEGCAEVYNAVEFHLQQTNLRAYYTLKRSTEHNRLYVVKVASILSLGSFANMEGMETHYSRLMMDQNSRLGVHSDKDWLEKLPSPLTQSAWSSDYTNERTLVRNNRIRAAFDRCVDAGIIVLSAVQADTRAKLLRAPAGEQPMFQELELMGSLEERLQMLEAVRNRVWSEDRALELFGMGQYGNKDGQTPLRNIRENTLRYPEVCAEIEMQAKLLGSYDEFRNKLLTTKYYFYAVVCGLIFTKGFNVLLKNAEADMLPKVIYDKSQAMQFPEYRQYLGFSSLCDKQRRDNLDDQSAELRREISEYGAESEKTKAVVERLEKALETCKTERDEADRRFKAAVGSGREEPRVARDFYDLFLSQSKSYLMLIKSI